jgi:diacylglycerol kinase family enzyme
VRSKAADSPLAVRAAAALALLGGAATRVAAGLAVGPALPRVLLLPALLGLALALAWLGLVRRGPVRLSLNLVAALLLGLALGIMAARENFLELAVVLGCGAISVVAARVAFAPRRALPRRPAPSHPVLFVNPRSGGGKAIEVGLATAARRRGIETVELGSGDDLEELVRAAVGRGCDGLAMAGGDGSQALVAAIAAEHDLAYACIPSGTRNHFALDLGVDREDVVGALDAFVEGGERLVDLAEVNGRVFVNNASLGVYAEAVNRDEYRESKLRTVMEAIPDAIGPQSEAQELSWRGPDGETRHSTGLVLVSNNSYRLGPAIGSGTRPRLDAGVLGIVAVTPPGGKGARLRWEQLEAEELEVDAQGPVPIGIDGEALELEPPLRFRVRPRALRVRVASEHPGASPASAAPSAPLRALGELTRIAFRGPRSAS